ncbi:unnamed protein product [Orchesella dallaii]|uniref:Uncharacterized protein n=1 Tax=Orchesella dallaii TaxID=48710 RepID=A0ABP1QKT5_9HEXA
MIFFYWVLLGSVVFSVILLIFFGVHCLCSRPPRLEISDHQYNEQMSEIEINYEHEATNITFNSRRRQLASLPSAPLLTALVEGETYHGSGADEIRSVQDNVLASGHNTSDSHLVVGVHANPRAFGGYCVNPKEKSVEFYIINSEDLPWGIHSRSDGAEYEMKNLLFALMLWSEKIKEVRKLHVYTSNNAINADNHRYGRRAAKLLEHYSGCCNVVVNESRVYVNRNESPDLYATYVLPALDLAHGNLYSAQAFLLQYYDIKLENFKGTHRIPLLSEPSNMNQSITTFGRTTYYHEFTREVKGFMQDCTTPCPTCGYVDDETASMTSINRIP